MIKNNEEKSDYSVLEKLGVLTIAIFMVIVAFYVLWDLYTFFFALIFIIVFIVLGVVWYLIPYYMEINKIKSGKNK